MTLKVHVATTVVVLEINWMQYDIVDNLIKELYRNGVNKKPISRAEPENDNEVNR